jgi:hypothetical protein
MDKLWVLLATLATAAYIGAQAAGPATLDDVERRPPPHDCALFDPATGAMDWGRCP